MRYSEKGSLLIAIIIAIVIVSALGAGIATMVTTGVRSSTDHSLSIQALYLAESGFEWATSKLREHYNSTGSWEDYCSNNLANAGTNISLSSNKYFTILSAVTLSNGCSIKILGWVGNSNKEKDLASRRLEGMIPGWFIQGSVPPTNNMFSGGDDDWKQSTGKNVKFSEGQVIFKKPGKGKGQGSKAQTNAPTNVIQDFGSGEHVFFGAYVKDLENISSHDFDLTVGPGKIAECSISFNGTSKLTSDCGNANIPANPLSDMLLDYNLLMYLGNDLHSENFGFLRLTLDWDQGNPNEVVFEYGCLGPSSICSNLSYNYITNWNEE